MKATDSPISNTRIPAASPTLHRPLRTCTVAYSLYESDARVMRYGRALRLRGDEVDVIALRAPAAPRRMCRDGVTVFGIQTRVVNERSQLSYLVRTLAFFVRALLLLSWRQWWYRYDVIHIHSVPDFLIFSAVLPKLMGAKIILDIHDLVPELYSSKFRASSKSLIVRLLLRVERLSSRFADHVITANDLWHRTLIGRSVPAAKATSLLNVPDLSIFSPRGRTRADDRFVIIYPGSLNHHQGLDLAIKAFAAIRDRVPSAEFVIYGSGPALPTLIELVGALHLQDRVHFKSTLSIHEIARVIENADLGVVPKLKNAFGNEAFSTKTLEFMALGVPVIVADTKIDKYYFSESVVKFFRGGCVDDLAACMLEVITTPTLRESLRQHGLEFVKGHCWDVTKQLYYELLDSLTSK